MAKKKKQPQKNSRKKTTGSTRKKKATKKSASSRSIMAADSASADLIRYRAVCLDCDWRAGIRHDSADDAIEYGVERHGNPKGHAIDAIGTQ